VTSTREWGCEMWGEKVKDGATKEFGASVTKAFVGLLGSIILTVVAAGKDSNTPPPPYYPVPPQTIPLSPSEIAKAAIHNELMRHYPQKTITPQEMDRLVQKIVGAFKTLQVEEQQRVALKLAAEAVEQVKHEDCVSMVNHMDVEGLPNMNDAFNRCMETGPNPTV